MNEHLDRAREYLTIAESGDAKREAYKRAAEEIATHQAKTGDTMSSIAILLGCSAEKVRKLVQWRGTGYAAPTPFLMDERATDRAARSHSKTWLTTAPPEEVHGLIQNLPPERRTIVAAAATRTWHDPPPTGPAGDYLREPAPDPSEYEIDHLVLDLVRKARELLGRATAIAERVEAVGVRTLGDPANTADDLEAALGDIAATVRRLGEVRAAVTEHLNERTLR